MPRNSDRIQKLNDIFRTTLIGGLVNMTDGIASLPETEVAEIVRKVRLFDVFNEDNDPYGEHDFGIIQHQGQSVYFKIDYYDKEVLYGSEDPSDPEVTTRVMTIMFSYEY